MTTETISDTKAFLIVDDEPLVRMDLVQIVEDCGFRALEAADTAAALKLLEAQSSIVAGLITDINMPGTRSGIVLAKHVRYVWPHIKVIVLSGARKPIPGDLPEQAEFLSKPVPLPQLVSTIQSFASR